MRDKDEEKEFGNADATAPADYIRAVTAHLRKSDQRRAYAIVQKAAALHPDNPVVLSYYGTLQASVDKKYQTGVRNCSKALGMIHGSSVAGTARLYPVLYLNLGRAFVAAGKKKNALDAFRKGLQYDKRNSAILKELQMLGIRRNPVMPFLGRSNPINKYLGMIINPEGKTQGRGRRSRDS